jgi:long-chain acyl-CoA synthetase
MKWKLFSRKKRKKQWRFFFKPHGDMADVMALPGAVIEGRLAGRYLLSSGSADGTVIVQGVSRKGILAGPDVTVDQDLAAKNDVDVAFQPRSGRASLQPAGTINLETMMLEAKDEFVAAPSAPEDLAVILYTSGTTGQPKGVQLTVGNIASEQEATDQALDIKPNDKVIAVLPFFHVFGLSNVLHLALVHGASVVLVPQYSPGNLLKTIMKSQPSLIIAIPTMYVHLQVLMARKGTGLPESVRLCVSGAAPLPVETIEAFEKAAGSKVLEGYGLTETVGACCLNPPKGKTKIGSIGIPLAGYEMKIVNKNGKECPQGEVGEIAVKGKGVTEGYYNLPEDTKEAIVNNWFLSGDLGYQDEDGYFFVTDRKKELIIKGGFNISPREVEIVLSGHAAVKEAAVIGQKKGEREDVVAFVTTKEPVSAKELLSHCKASLSSFKVPDTIHFMDVLPMSLTGKVLKKELVEGFQDERGIEPNKT